MPVTTLRASGGAVVMSVPRKLLDIVNLRVGSKVEIGIKGDGFVVNPVNQRQPKYTLDEVLSRCGRGAFRRSSLESNWLGDGPRGKEII